MIGRTYGLTKRQLGTHLTWFGLWLAVTVIAAILTPNSHGHGTHQQLGLPPCPSVLLFGRPCPGCGLTTSFTAFVHGQFIHAFEANPFGPLLYIAFTISAFYCLYGFIKGVKFDMNTRRANWAIAAFVVAYLGFGAIRFAMTSPAQYAAEYWRPGINARQPSPAQTNPR